MAECGNGTAGSCGGPKPVPPAGVSVLEVETAGDVADVTGGTTRPLSDEEMGSRKWLSQRGLDWPARLLPTASLDDDKPNVKIML